MIHISNSTSSGSFYNNATGIWNISAIEVGKSIELKLTVKITALGKVEPTQLAVLMDGSGSIWPEDWALFTKGLSNAINTSIPHTGDIELTIIEFARNYIMKSHANIYLLCGLVKGF